MRVHDRARPRPTGSHQRGTQLRAFDHRQSGTQMFNQEPARGHRTGEVNVSGVGLQRQVVTEPLRLLICIHMTAHPGKQRGVVDDTAVGPVQSQPIRQPHRDQALAQHMLHRQAHAQIEAKRQRRQQFRQPNALTRG